MSLSRLHPAGEGRGCLCYIWTGRLGQKSKDVRSSIQKRWLRPGHFALNGCWASVTLFTLNIQIIR